MPISAIEFDQRVCAEMAGRGEMKIGVEIVRHPLLRRISGRGFHPIVHVVDAPEIKRQPLAEMAENDLQTRAIIEQAAADQP